MKKIVGFFDELKEKTMAGISDAIVRNALKKDKANKRKEERNFNNMELFNSKKATSIQADALSKRFGKFIQDGILITAFDSDPRENVEVNAFNEELIGLLNFGNTPISEILASDAYKNASEATRRIVDCAISDEPSGVVERFYDNGAGNIIRINNAYIYGYKTVLENGENGISTHVLSGREVDLYTADLIDKYAHMETGGDPGFTLE